MRQTVSYLRLQGVATAHDVEDCGELAGVITGDAEAKCTEPIGEDEILALEFAAVLSVMRKPETLARMEHTLATGKPLRN